MKTAIVRARIDSSMKQAVEGILENLGLSVSAAINLFFRQIVLREGLPFNVEIPNAVTRQAILDARAGRNQIAVNTREELYAALKRKFQHPFRATIRNIRENKTLRFDL